MGNKILGIRVPYKAILYGLKIKAENEKINDSIEIDIILIVISISLVVQILPLASGFCAKYEKWIDKRQASERLIDENKKKSDTGGGI